MIAQKLWKTKFTKMTNKLHTGAEDDKLKLK